MRIDVLLDLLSVGSSSDLIVELEQLPGDVVNQVLYHKYYVLMTCWLLSQEHYFSSLSFLECINRVSLAMISSLLTRMLYEGHYTNNGSFFYCVQRVHLLTHNSD